MQESSKKTPEYRIVTDGEVFRIEIKQSYTTGWFRKKLVEWWSPCDIMLNSALDDDGLFDPLEIYEYESFVQAAEALNHAKRPYVGKEWKVVEKP